MSAPALRWLNDELKLRRQVSSMERDLSNGFLFAEILSLKGLEPSLNEYRDAPTIEAKVHNMELLGATLEALGLPFPVNTRRAIMMEDRSAVLQFVLLLKDFVDGSSRQDKAGIHQARASRVSPAKTVAMNASTASALHPRDVDERFVKVTAQRLQPTEVTFRKDVNMAVHLRKFDQAQWKTENELQDFRNRSRAEHVEQKAAGINSVRTHLQDKRKFMKEWDHEHLLKWKETQRRDCQLERDNLRLESTLEKRKEIFRERALDASLHDGVSGVVEFERNMGRLGLGLGGTDQVNLRAIPADDEGALAHFYTLERCIQELDFRPSSNVKMMKEIKRRRKAQLAAEKDRRVRKQRAAAEQKESEACDNDDQDVYTGDLQDKSEPASAPKVKGDTFPDYLTEVYLDGKLEELEMNYAQLRVSGQQRRDTDMEILRHIRNMYAKKSAQTSQTICEDVSNRLISLAYTVASTSSIDDLGRLCELKQAVFIEEDSESNSNTFITIENQAELSAISSSFRRFEGSWARAFQQSAVCTNDITTELRRVLDEFDRATLSTAWQPSLKQPLVTVYTEDENGNGIARRIAAEHGLILIELDQVVEESVKLAYDTQKQADAAALMPERERVLGAIGFKIALFRQKGAPLSDVLIVDVVVAAIGIEITAETAVDNDVSTKRTGCALLNFPRTVDEAKLLEIALAARTGDQTVREAKLQEIETAFCLDAECGDACTSRIDCVVSILPITVEQHAEECADTDEVPSEGKRPSTANRTTTGKSRATVPSQVNQDQLLAQAVEERALLARIWRRLTHYLQIDPSKMQADVAVEGIHLGIDTLVDTALKGSRCNWELIDDAYPKELVVARMARRDQMALSDRLKWAKASNEVTVDLTQLDQLVDKLTKIDDQITIELERAFGTFMEILIDTTTRCSRRDEKLQEILSNEDEKLQIVVLQARDTLTSLKSTSDREKSLTVLEVTLGDLVDDCRCCGNQFVESLSSNPLFNIMSGSDDHLQLIPTLFLYVQVNALDRLELLQRCLFEHIPFLSDQDGADTGSGQAVALSRDTTSRAMDAVMAIRSIAQSPIVGHAVCEEMLRQLSQIAAAYAFHVGKNESASRYSLHEANVKTIEITRALEFCAVLCNFGERFFQTLSRLNARSIAKLRNMIQDDMHAKHLAIADVVQQMRASSHSFWPPSVARAHTSNGIGWRLAFGQRNHILTPQNLLVLTMAFRAQTNGSNTIVAQDFVKTVLAVAKKNSFPPRWQDPVAVARMALQQEYCSISHGSIHWRQWIVSLLALSYVGLPSVEHLQRYVAGVCNIVASRVGENARAVDFVLTSDEFGQVPLWFEGALRVELKKLKASQVSLMIQVLKQVLQALFSVDGGNEACDSSVKLLPMLLCWCVHPVCDFRVHPKLAGEFLPSYSRGLLRAFHVLLALGGAPSSEPPRVDSGLAVKLLEAAGMESTGSSPAESSWGPRDAPAFLRFCDARARGLERLLLLRNSFEALAEPSAASP